MKIASTMQCRGSSIVVGGQYSLIILHLDSAVVKESIVLHPDIPEMKLFSRFTMDNITVIPCTLPNTSPEVTINDFLETSFPLLYFYIVRYF